MELLVLVTVLAAVAALFGPPVPAGRYRSAA